MNELFLNAYNRELTHVHQLAAEFAQRYPKIASRLMLSEAAEDPHVARLVQSFAFMNARLRLRLDDDLPEIAEALLQLVAPAYMEPLPSLAMIQFLLNEDQATDPQGAFLPRGTLIESELVEGAVCRFTTCHGVRLLPVRLVSAELSAPPFRSPRVPQFDSAEGLFSIHLQTMASSVTLGQLDLDPLQLFFDLPLRDAFDLYELLFNDTLGVAAATATDAARVVQLPPGSFSQTGFSTDEQLYPEGGRHDRTETLLEEMFCFPWKFLSGQFNGLNRACRQLPGNDLHLFFFLRRRPPQLSTGVSSGNIRIGCAPAINRYAKRAEPISVTMPLDEYPLAAAVRRPDAEEILSIRSVTAVDSDGRETRIPPLYSFGPSDRESAAPTYWIAAREAAGAGRSARPGMALRLLDGRLQPSTLADCTLNVEVQCCNGDLPTRLPTGAGRPLMQLAAGGASVSIRCLTRPTPMRRDLSARGWAWSMVSQLAPHYLSISGGASAAAALKAMLRLSSVADMVDTSSLVEGIVAVDSRQVVGPALGAAEGTFCRGVEITVTFDPALCGDRSMYLFASVLERFFAIYCGEHSFVRVVARTLTGELCRWNPRTGEKSAI